MFWVFTEYCLPLIFVSSQTIKKGIMKVQLLIEKIKQGIFNADQVAIALDENGIEVTSELYDELREAELQYKNQSFGFKVDDIVTVKGENGNSDFRASFRGGRTGFATVYPINGGMQIEVPIRLVSK